MDAPTWDANRHLRQAVVNAVSISPRHLQRDLWPAVPARVRLVWERDGEDWVETTYDIWATTEAGSVVCVDHTTGPATRMYATVQISPFHDQGRDRSVPCSTTPAGKVLICAR